jgi:predicted outer membrane repeat protein
MPGRRMTVVTLLALGWAGGARAETFHVYPGESIQAAIDLADAGDEIVVHPGTYSGPINFCGKAITLRSTDGPTVTTLDGQQADTVVMCRTGEGPSTVLDGFLVVGGQGAPNGGGMLIEGASPTVHNCVFQGNQAQYGGGIFAQSAQPTLVQCTFDQNTASASGGAMYNYGYPGEFAAVLLDCRFSENYVESAGGALRNWDSSPTLVGCVFYANHARYSGAGVANGGASHPNFTDCTFDGNRTDTLFGNWDCFGGGMSNFESSSPILVNCVFLANSAVALYPRLSRGGALANAGSAQPELINCTLSGNHANIGRALSNVGTACPAVSSSILWDGGDEIVNEGTATLSIGYSDVQGYWPGPGNISEDPRLDDLRLQPDSPCINTGDPNYAPPGARDLDGHARVLGGRVDMGAYEFGIGDYDGDRDVDTQDFVGGAACLTGPDNGPYGAGCEALDFEYDSDVDLADLAAFQVLLGG